MMNRTATLGEYSRSGYFRFQTSLTLKGIAILFLLIGHYSLFCIDGKQVTETWGSVAVILFLLISGFGITTSNEGRKMTKLFIIKRLRKLLVPVWVTLLLFYSLDYLLLKKTYSVSNILLSFLGIITTSSPDEPLWFVTFII